MPKKGSSYRQRLSLQWSTKHERATTTKLGYPANFTQLVNAAFESVVSNKLATATEDSSQEGLKASLVVYLRNARLVCHQWNKIATAHLFRTSAFDARSEDGARSWNHLTWSHMVNSETIQRVVQNAAIHSHPGERDMYEDASDAEGWITDDDDGNVLGLFRRSS